MKAKCKSEKAAAKPAQADLLKAINDGNDSESELENERSSTLHNIKPIENSAPVKNPSSSEESSSSSSSSSSDEESSSSGSTSSDEDDDSSSSSSSSSSSDEESSTSSGDCKKVKNLNPISTDINMNKPPLIKMPKIINSQKNSMFSIKQINRQPMQRITPEAKPVFEPKPVLNPTPPPHTHTHTHAQLPSTAQSELTAASDENDSNIEPQDAQQAQEVKQVEEDEDETKEDPNNITIEEIIVNINSPNKKSSSKTTSPILPSTPDSKHETKTEQTAKSSSQSSSITFTLSDDEISDDSNASNQNVKNLYSFGSGFSAIKSNTVANRSSDESANKSDLNNNSSLNLSSNLDDTLLNDSKPLPFSSEQPKSGLKLESDKVSTPSPSQSLNQPLSAGFVPSRPVSFMDLMENADTKRETKCESKTQTVEAKAGDKEAKDENDEEVKNIFSPEEKKKRPLGQNSVNSEPPLDSKQDVNSKKIKNETSFIEKSSDLLNKFDLEKKDSINLLKKIANGDLARLGPCSPLTNQIVNQMNLDESALICSNGTTSSNVADQIQYSADGRPKLIVSIELDLIKLLNMNLAPSEPPVIEAVEKKSADKVRHNKQKESPRERSRERSREVSPKRSSSHYKDYKRSSVSSSSSSRGSDYREKSSRDRDTKSSRSDSKSKSTSSSKNKSDSDSKEYRKDSSSYKSTSNSQSVKRSSILNEDQDLTNTSKKQKLSAEQTLSNSVKPALKVPSVNKSPIVDKQARESDNKASVQTKQTSAKGNAAESKISNGLVAKTAKIEKTKFSKTFDFLNT